MLNRDPARSLLNLGIGSRTLRHKSSRLPCGAVLNGIGVVRCETVLNHDVGVTYLTIEDATVLCKCSDPGVPYNP